MERCPACRARLGAEPLCPRCGCDLSLALQAETAARRLAAAALRELAAGHWRKARIHARRAVALRADPFHRAVLQLVRRRCVQRGR
jgi:hypothetical protein